MYEPGRGNAYQINRNFGAEQTRSNFVGNNIKFPRNLRVSTPSSEDKENSPGSYGGSITFRAFETEPPNPGSITQDFNDLLSRAAQESMVALESAKERVGAFFTGGSAGEDASPRSREAAIAGRRYSSDPSSHYEPRAKFTNKSVTLYMPPALQIGDKIDIDNTVPFGMFGEALNRSLGAGGGITSALTDATGRSLGSLVNALGGQALSQEAVSLGISKAAGALGAGGEGAVRTALGITPNPNIRAVFRSVGIRTFSFTFKMTPRDKTEADDIGKIIKFFRTNAYPETFSLAGIPAGFKFPNKFQIHFQYNGKDIATKTHLSFLTDIQTTYNPQTMSFYEEGNFQETDLVLTFIEERTIDRQHVEAGY